ncbi:MAG: glycyl-radical enzyme activating protein [Oscillospiraceae bacterium]|nr:glycyl-radical enzyme activating protein [Oscillospiraceae bacterium]
MGRIVSVKHFEIHDGPGVRTTLFLKGCPLHCRWCHNPEAISSAPQLAFTESKCLSCGLCAKHCAAHQLQNGKHVHDQVRCCFCGSCEEICIGSALRFYGKEAAPEEILSELLEDRDFYGNTGGVTVSGGEPLMQPEFTAAVLSLLKQEGIHTAVDTCGFASREALETVLPYTDLFLYDIKAVDPAVHRRCTGADNRLILENLRYLDGLGIPMEIRFPLVPGWNDGETDAVGQLLASLIAPPPVKVLPCHNYAGDKYASLGLTMEPIPQPTAAQTENALHCLAAYGLTVIDGRA